MQKNYSSLMDYALRIISKKRYTVSEMRKKLGGFLKRSQEKDEGGDSSQGPGERSEPGGLAEDIIDRLIELNYLNDLDYAKNYISDRARFRPRGKMLIKRELMARGIGKEELQKALSDDGEGYDEVAGAEELIRRRERAWSGLELKVKKEKAYRFLQSKGFARDTIYKVLRSCYNRITE